MTVHHFAEASKSRFCCVTACLRAICASFHPIGSCFSKVIFFPRKLLAKMEDCRLVIINNSSGTLKAGFA
jgi:hypothetical protein